MQDIGNLYEQGKTESRRQGNHAQTLACWEIGRRIRQSDLGENGRAAYGEMLMPKRPRTSPRNLAGASPNAT